MGDLTTTGNVIFVLSSVWRTLTYHVMRLSSVWPIKFQYRCQAAATVA